MFSIVAQIIGILGMTMNIISFQAKEQKRIITIQLFGAMFFAVNMAMLQAYTGAILNLVGIVRAITYMNKDKIKNIKAVNIAFFAVYALSYIATFTVFNKEVSVFNCIIELLPVIGMVATTISFSMQTSASVRKMAFISSPAWLIYNCVNRAVGGALCEIFSLISVITAVIRLDIKKEDTHGSAKS